MGENREQFLSRMEKENAKMREEFKHLKCIDCKNLRYWDGYYCELGKHQCKDEKLSFRPLKNCEGYCKRDIEWFWGLREESLNKFYPDCTEDIN